ncbi:MAG TPA: PIG-L family deacetylase, partial [Limnochordia bacterium]
MALNWSDQERVLVLAPHCDDETLGAGGVIATLTARGARVWVALMTNGDGFLAAAAVGRGPLPRRLSPQAYIDLAHVRRQEARRALAHVGVREEDIFFLGYPDRGLASMWRDYWDEARPFRSRFTRCRHSPYDDNFTPGAPYAGAAVVRDLRRLFSECRPRTLIVPHPHDAHGDHWATYCFATFALASLRLDGEPWADDVRLLAYLVHRGGWPRPRGLVLRAPMVPPAALVARREGEQWVSVPLAPQAISAKARALGEYHSQLTLLGRFLLSFVRRNELFDVVAPQLLPASSSAAIAVDGEFDDWPAQAVYVADPVRDTLTRSVERSADIKGIGAAWDGENLYVRLDLQNRVAAEVGYHLTACAIFPGGRRRRVHVRLMPPDRVSLRVGWRFVPSHEVAGRARADRWEVALPGSLLGYPKQLLLGAHTVYRLLTVDRTTWLWLDLGPAPLINRSPQGRRTARGVVYATARRRDLAGAARVFSEGFAASLEHVFGKIPPLALVQQIFALLHDAEPDGLIIARRGSDVIGYIFCPSSLRRLWRTALLRGHLFRWALGWLQGTYRFGFAPLAVLLTDKVHFLRSAM